MSIFPIILTTESTNGLAFGTLTNPQSDELTVVGGSGSNTNGISGHRMTVSIPTQLKPTPNTFNLFRGKTEGAWAVNGTVVVNPILSTGAEDTANPVTVYVHVSKLATDPTTGHWPVIIDNQYVLYMRDKEGDYILVHPDVEISDTCAT